MRNIRVVDANVILRFLLADEPAHFDQARAFMAQVKTGEAGAYIPEGVLVECVYVLLKVYQARSGVPDTLSEECNPSPA